MGNKLGSNKSDLPIIIKAESGDLLRNSIFHPGCTVDRLARLGIRVFKGLQDSLADDPTRLRLEAVTDHRIVGLAPVRYANW